MEQNLNYFISSIDKCIDLFFQTEIKYKEKYQDVSYKTLSP